MDAGTGHVFVPHAGIDKTLILAREAVYCIVELAPVSAPGSVPVPLSTATHAGSIARLSH